jgi:aldehyde:ferredoxin oxidoreductase
LYVRHDGGAGLGAPHQHEPGPGDRATGWEDFDEEEAFTVGERVSNLLRLVYARRGFKKSDEFDLSPRFLEITRVSSAKEKGIAPYLPAMVDEYYRLQG